MEAVAPTSKHWFAGAAGCCCNELLEAVAVMAGCVLWNGHAGAAVQVSLQGVALSRCHQIAIGTHALSVLQAWKQSHKGAKIVFQIAKLLGSQLKYRRRCLSAFWSGHVGAAAGNCLRVLLSEWCLRFGASLLAVVQGATSGCCS